jgi:iron complex outermembrane recepter protein
MRMKLKVGKWSIVVVPCVALGLPSAQAQSPSAGEKGGLDEIVVTARRTEESIQTVPVTMTAFDAELLRENTISTPEDLQLSTPGVFLSGSGGRQNVLYAIRGRSKAASGTSPPAVVSYFAEVPDPTWGSFVPQYDMASVQVLKGPQGTLFGRNTLGGALLYQPQTPSHELGGYVNAGFGNHDNQDLKAAVDIPLLQDRVALRLAGNLQKRDGYTENVGVGGDLDAIDIEGFRISLLVEPTDYLRNLTIYDHYKSDNDGFGASLKNIFTGNTLLNQLGLQTSALQELARQRARGPFAVNSAFAQYERNERDSIINRTELDLGPVQVINIFGYRDTDLAYATNVDAMPTLTADGTGPLPAGTPVNFIKADLNQSQEQFSDELQVKGQAFGDQLDWLLGAFWLKSQPTGPQGNAVSFAQIPGLPLTAPAYLFVTERSKAVFGHITYGLDGLLEGLGVEVGVRYTEDEIESCIGSGVNTAPGPVFASSNQVSLDDCENRAANISGASTNAASSNATTWSVGLNWEVNDDWFAYIVSRHGYRSGGINGPTFSGRMTQFQAFEPETVTDAEAGIRADWSIGNVDIRSNISAYIARYEDVQNVLGGVQTSGLCNPANPNNPPGISPDGDCSRNNDPAGGTLLVNFGEGEVSGVDVELVVAPTPGLSLSVAANYTKTKTKSFDVPVALDPYVSTEEISFAATPKRTMTAGVRYELPFETQLYNDMIFNADYYWTEEFGTEIIVPSYDVLNARIDINGIAGSNFDLGIFMRNVLDDEYQALNAASGTFLGLQTIIYGPPRMYGAELRYSF